MAEPTIHPITPPVAPPITRDTDIPTQPPPGYERRNRSASSWPAVAETGIREGAGLVRRHQGRASERIPRPRASTMTVVCLVWLIFLTVGIAIGAPAAWLGHQWGTEDYNEQQVTRHTEVMDALKAQQTAIEEQREELAKLKAASNENTKALYGAIDVMAEHHPEASKVGRQLERGRVRP